MESTRLEENRRQIDRIDRTIAGLLDERLDLVKSVADYKLKNDMEIFVPEREKKVIDKVSSYCDGTPEKRAYLRDAFSGIMAASRKFQKKRIGTIFLIGMPGCGKSTIGEKIAECLGRDFIDGDSYFEIRYSQSPKDYILDHTEKAFREKESICLSELAKKKQKIIALGGGIVTVQKNRELIPSDAFIVYIKRPIAELPVEGRPLSQLHGTEKLFEERKNLYESWADIIVDNEGVEKTAAKVISIIENL